MSNHFKTAAGILETTKNVLNFMKDNAGMFWHYLKPYLPYLIVAHLAGLAGKLAGWTGETGMDIGDMIAGFFVTCFMITWHRFVMFGPQRAVLVNPLMLKRHEWHYVMAAVVMGLFVFSITAAGTLAGILPALVVTIVTLGLLGVVLWGMVRFSPYFPAKAAGTDMSPAQAFTLSKGRAGAIAGSYLMVTIALFVPMYVVGLILVVIAALFAGLGDTARMAVQHIVMMPVDVVLVPMLAVGAATVLTNFYMLAAGHKRR